MNYYNEFDPKAAAWLRELINQKLIPNGHIDTRSICDVRPEDLNGFNQCHFFAGIGGWPLALQLAGVSPDEHLWTGSCPCQPFSISGKGLGTADSRHLWPEFKRLIAQRRPAKVFGEQVASPAGRTWLQGVFADLEKLGYAVAGADLCAAGVGAPHIRQRLWWFADFDGNGMEGQRIQPRAADPHGQGWSDSTATLLALGPLHGIQGVIEPVILGKLDGVPAGMVRLRGYGNAIVPQIASEFIIACMEARRRKSKERRSAKLQPEGGK